jgi:dihydropyrimidinase
MRDLLVRGGTVVLPEGERRADVRCRGGRVAEVGADLSPQGEQVLDAGEALVLPGVIDPHLHFALVAEPHRTADDFASGSASALAGGVTTYIDFAHQRAGQSFEAAVDERLEQASSSRADYSLHLIVTDIAGGQLDELPRLTRRGVTSAKVYTTYRAAGFFCDDYSILRLMEIAAGEHWVVMVHCENDAIVEGTRDRLVREGKTALRYHGLSRPAFAEVETVGRMIAFARETSCALYAVHVSVGASARLVAEARTAGLAVVGETCPQFLVADDSVYDGERASRFIHTPPLRSKADQRSLWEELRGEGLQTMCSDHSGYTLSQRTDYDDITKVAPGIPGTETILPLLFTYGVETGRLELSDLVRICCLAPAKTFGLYPRKGRLEPGADADLVVYDPHPARTLSDGELHSAAGYSPYAGLAIRGRVTATVLRAEVVYDGDDVCAEPGSGRFVARLPVPPEDLP